MPKLPVADPLIWFDTWFDEAKQSAQQQPTAMSLSTVDEAGQPTVRIVLLKGFDRKGFVFYTNLESAKARHLKANPNVGLCFLWKQLCRQVRIDGTAHQIDDEEADEYFATRPRGSQIGAWASKQSHALEGRDELMERVEHFREKFADKQVPRPPFWSGYRVVPERFEFWQLGDDRLHDRWQFDRLGDGWQWERSRLYP